MRRYRSSSSSRTPPGNFHPKPSVAGFLPAKNYSYSYYQKTTIQTTTRTVKNSCSVVGRPRPRPLLPRETPFARFSTRKKRTTTTMISIATPSADGADAEEDEERMQWWWYYHSSRRAFLRVVLTEYRYAYVPVFAAEREREERGTFARESCDDEKDRLKRSTTALAKYSSESVRKTNALRCLLSSHRSLFSAAGFLIKQRFDSIITNSRFDDWAVVARRFFYTYFLLSEVVFSLLA